MILSKRLAVMKILDFVGVISQNIFRNRVDGLQEKVLGMVIVLRISIPFFQ